MAFHNIPPNGFPDIPDMEELEAVVKDVNSLKTSVSGLATDVSNLSDNKANQITIAPFFDPETSYEVGDLVYYNGLSYRCTNDHEGEWDADDFATTTVSGELATLKSGLIGDRFAVVTGTTAEAVDQFTTVSMPSGFSAYNAVIIGFTSQFSNDLWYTNNGGLIVDANAETVYVTVKDAGFASKPFKVVLYKFA